MHVKDPKSLRGNKSAPFSPLSANAILPGGPAKRVAGNKLSAAFAAALGKSAGGADTPPASAGRDQTRGGTGRPDQINKASRPATGRKNFSGNRSGHR